MRTTFDTVIVDVRTPAPCPLCAEDGGFHNDETHAVVRGRIPAHLVRPSNSQLRRDERDRRPHEPRRR